MGTGIKGFKSQKMLKTKLKGYTDDQSIDPERYVTIQEIPGDRYAADVMIHGAYKVNLLGFLTVAAGSNVRVIKCTAHGAQKGDFVKFVGDATDIQVLSAPDANTIVLATELSFDPTGLTFDVLRGVTPSYNKDGSLNVLSAQGPVQYRDANTGLPQETVFDETDITNNRPLPSMNTFKQDGNYIPVNEDSAVAANNKPMPSGLMIKKDDGNYYPVTLDTTNPYAHTPIPVVITDVSGTSVVNVTASDLNVSIKHNGADPSSVRIGDGTNLASVSAANALKVDGSAVTQPISGTVTANLGTIDGVATSANQTNGSQITQIKSGSNGNVLDIITLATSPTGGEKGLVANAIMHGYETGSYNDVRVNNAGEMYIHADSLPLPTGAATEATQLTQNSYIGALTETAPATDTASSGLNGRLQRIAQRLTSLISQFPATLGITTKSGSLSVAVASDQATQTAPLGIRESDGTNWLSSIALSAAQLTSGALTAIRMGACVIMGWDGTTHRELAVNTDGSIKTSNISTSGTITQAQKTVNSITGGGAIRATVSGIAPSSTRKKLWIKPSVNNTGAIYIGGSSVTISTGLMFVGPDLKELINDASDWYLISDTDGQVVEIIEVN